MRDAVELERRGIPTVMVSQDVFEAASKAQARVLGMPDLPLVIAPQPRPSDTPEKLERDVEDAFKSAVAGLTRPVARPAGR